MRIDIELTKKQSLLDQTIGHVENILYGGARGSGKSQGLRYVFLKGCISRKNIHATIFRKTYPELYGNHISKMLEEFPMLTKYYNHGNKEYRFPNGSVLMFRHNQYAKDLGNHQGVEYQWLGIDEAGDWPEEWFWFLKGSNRSSNPKITPRCVLTGNPGGIGHKWLKRLFVDRQFREIEKSTDFEFIPARVYDNPALMKADPGYIDRLRSNKNPVLVKAYLEGSWDIQAGQFFDMMSRDVHLIEPFEIPSYWRRYGMFDTGFNHPAGFLWMATDEDGDCYFYREYCVAQRHTEEIVQDISEFPDTFKLQSIVSGHDSWIKASRGGGPSVEEKFAEASNNKLILEKANIDRVAGAQQLRDYLVVRENGPRIKIFKTCPILFDTLCRMTHDPKNPEDVLKIDSVDGDPYTGDELYDCARMGVMERPEMSVKPVTKPRDKYAKEKDESNWMTV